MLVSCLPCKAITEDCTGLFSKTGKSVLLCSLCSSALSALCSQSDPAVCEAPCTASAHLMLGHLLSPRADGPGCTWMQDSNTVGSLGTAGFLI